MDDPIRLTKDLCRFEQHLLARFLPEVTRTDINDFKFTFKFLDSQGVRANLMQVGGDYYNNDNVKVNKDYYLNIAIAASKPALHLSIIKGPGEFWECIDESTPLQKGVQYSLYLLVSRAVLTSAGGDESGVTSVLLTLNGERSLQCSGDFNSTVPDQASGLPLKTVNKYDLWEPAAKVDLITPVSYRFSKNWIDKPPLLIEDWIETTVLL